ncbi:MAG: Uma2 family endonuclease [Acidobacteria bacterium]|nr:Uma2 family endonuclease [Acidobacteriota bacterium]
MTSGRPLETVTAEPITPASAPPFRQRRLTVDEYHRMTEAGILNEDDHVEMVEGLLVAMTPQGRSHAVIIQRLTALLVRALPETYGVLPQLPLTLGGHSEPEPDMAVVDAREAEATGHHPHTALLVVEIAGDSLRYDRTIKAALYAEAGIPEYWIFDVEARRVEVRRDPDVEARRYRTLVTLGPEDTLVCGSLAGVSIPLATLIP